MTESDKSKIVDRARAQYSPRALPAVGPDVFGKHSNSFIAMNAAGHRIALKAFYKLDGDSDFERSGYLLLTTARELVKA